MPNPIQFRQLKSDDAKALYEIYSDKIAMQYRGSKAMEHIEDAYQFVLNQTRLTPQSITIRRAIELTDDTKTLIGSIMYRYYKDRPSECEIGYSIGSLYWNKGYGTAVVQLLLETLKSKPQIRFISAWCHKKNVASYKILEKNGFESVIQTQQADYLLYRKLNT